MADQPKTPPFLAWGLYRERIGRNWSMEWRELGPVFLHDDRSGGIGHFKSFPSGGWNHRFAIRRYEDGAPPLPVLRAEPKRQQKQPTAEPDDNEPSSFFLADLADE